MSVKHRRLLLILGAALLLALSTLILASLHKGGRQGDSGQLTVVVFGCGDRTLEQLVAKAVEQANLTGLRIISGRPVRANVVVVDAVACVADAQETNYALEVFADTLMRGGVAILVGSPRLVSEFIKMQHKVLMAYPLPAINETIVYALRVARVSSTTTIGGSVGYIVAPEIAYWKGATAASLAKALEFALSKLEGTHRA